MQFRTLVTGSSGFVGSGVTLALARSGYTVRAASREPSTICNFPGVEWMHLPNLEEEFDWVPLLDDVDAVVHLAAIAHRTPGDVSQCDRVNRAAVGRLARACANQGIKRLIFVSSIGAQAGSAADMIVDERQEPEPVTAYDRSKLAAEKEICASGVPFTVLRPVLVYGPGAKANIASLMRLAATPFPLPFGAFKNKRSLLSIDNLNSAIMFCLERAETIGRTFIVSDPTPISLAEIIATCREASGRSPLLMPIPPGLIKAALLALGRRPLWDRIGRDLVATSEELQRLGWVPPMHTKPGLRASMAAMMKEMREGGRL
ncbi:NAD-dependent epimerase/dehydratase family protein [Bradyrhizobium centrosematis]|nr:NAD-dependent epimerase/dehydratase family protein [Bradyrhizobium centrosematis]